MYTVIRKVKMGFQNSLPSQKQAYDFSLTLLSLTQDFVSQFYLQNRAVRSQYGSGNSQSCWQLSFLASTCKYSTRKINKYCLKKSTASLFHINSDVVFINVFTMCKQPSNIYSTRSNVINRGHTESNAMFAPVGYLYICN